MDLPPPPEAAYEVHPIRSVRGNFANLNYLVLDRRTRQAALVDASWDLDAVAAKLEELDARLCAVLLTHSHFDHVHLVPAVIRRFRPQVFMSRTEADHYGFRCEGLETFAQLDTLGVGDLRFACLETPGHTAGSACYLLPGSLFTGDTLFSEGCGICHAPGGCPHRMFRSLQMLKHVAGEEDAVFPGHSYWRPPGRKFSALLKTNVYLAIEDEARFVEFAMRKSRLRLTENLRIH